MDLTIVVGTYGDHKWVELAQRAIRSARHQAPVIHEHADTLAKARNAGLAKVETELVVFLDADDELEAGYVDSMLAATADLRVPLLRQVRNRRTSAPFMPRVWGHTHACTAECLRFGNWMVIGTAVRADLARSVGGFEEWGWSEDWALWARCWKAGGTAEPVPAAVYRAHVRPGSRNHALPGHETLDWHRQIERAIWPDEPAYA